MEVMVARQPIFNHKQKVIAYELLFRNGFNNYFDYGDGDQATSQVLHNSFISIGMESLTRNTKAFINFTRNLLVDEVATIFPRELMVVEILETVEPDEAVIRACQRLKERGFTLVLDDFVFDPKFRPLIKLADIIKVDFLSTPWEECRRMVQRFDSPKIKFLAEKVETREALERAIQFGYHYFQGYFFSKPVIVSGRDIPGFKLIYLQLLQELHKQDFNYSKLESLIKKDVSLSYKLLKLINSSFFGLQRDIQSIRQALVLLGEREIRKWVTVIALSGMAQDKPEELIVTSLLHARFAESLAPLINMQTQSSELFLLGLFSLIDAFVDRPKSEILKGLPISDNVKSALLGEENPYRQVYDLIVAYERGNWVETAKFASQLNMDAQSISRLYLDSTKWINDIYNTGGMN
ncbi:MAG: HDOD domain-containing protein [Calditrichia bacterium]